MGIKMHGLRHQKNKNSKKNRKVRIMLFGTFDGVHRGHVNFFRQARKLAKNPFLIVSVARDLNVKKIKGSKPRLGEKARFKIISHLPIVDKVLLGGKRTFLPHIIKEKPDIIALGYDQAAYTANLGQKLFKAGLKVKVVRLKPYKKHVYKSSILRKVKLA